MAGFHEPALRVLQSSALLEAIRESGIMSEKRLNQLQEAAQESGAPDDSEGLAKLLIEKKFITEFQSRCLLRGKSKELVVGRYVILDYMGKGAMGRVYRAWHRLLGRTVALKLLDPHYLTGSTALARFRREMQLVGRLDHPNIVRALDADRVGPMHYIAMELLRGQTLADRLRGRGALPPGEVAQHAIQTAAGLGHAHSQGVVHRDIKPSNLLLTHENQIKILDFGLARLVEKDNRGGALTSDGIAVGTPDYISPEQARMVAIDGRSDLYSLGCTMYHLLSGSLPFPGESSMDCLIGRITGTAVPLTKAKPGVPGALVAVIEKLMQSNPDDRFQTAEEAAEALRRILKPRVAAVGPSAAVPNVRAFDLEPPTPAAPPAPPVPIPVPAPMLPPLAPRSRPGPKPKSGFRFPSVEVLRSHPVRVSALAGAAALALFLIGSQVLRSQGTERPTAPARPTQRAAATAGPAALAATSVPAPVALTPPASIDAAGLVIESPANGSKVTTRTTLVGRFTREGWPIIYVQSTVSGQPWWLQAPVAEVKDGKFTVPVAFGDQFTPSGTKFRVVLAAARSREEAQAMGIGPQGYVIPAELFQSNEVVVELR
jgi:serine/threonine-protein kinase